MLIFKEIKYCKSFLVYMKKIHFISVLKLMGMYGEALKEVFVYFESTKEKRRKLIPSFF
ncbi:unnamed protein product [Bacillus thuringiensis DB27]|uniref:Uncharacterized protein n=1 Tax=Bacillus thuringiensis DB27 TaxID=1431339 RepID=W8ZAM0_BACTU|nr:unnamed protein product [Bacillus thuringiensis DB27]